MEPDSVVARIPTVVVPTALLSATALLALVLTACTSSNDHVSGAVRSPSGSFDDAARQAATVLVHDDADTVWFWRNERSGTIVWTTDGSERWRSLYAYRATPVARLTDIDADSTADLFWTINQDGGPVGGMVLLASGRGAHTSFVSPPDACLPPDLVDVNRDHAPDVISYGPGLIAADSCRAFSFESCQERYPTEWRQAYVNVDGAFEPVDSLARTFYRQTAMLYHQTADRLNRFLGALDADSARTQACDSLMVVGLFEMSRRAMTAAGRTSVY